MRDDAADGTGAVSGASDAMLVRLDRLQRELEDLRTSRRRLVSAADEDRRAFESALHDGIQQSLVAFAVDLRRLAGLAETDPVSARALLDQMATDVRTAMAETTALAERIYPPLLAARGFAPGLRSAAERLGITIRVDAPATAEASTEVTTAVYWSCVEVLSSASPGSQATVHIIETDGVSSFEVTVDGDRAMIASTRLVDRVEAFDGRLTVDEGTDGGTRVHGSIPWSR